MNLSMLGKLSKQIMPKLGIGTKVAQKAEPVAQKANKFIRTGHIGMNPNAYETAIQCPKGFVRSENQLMNYRKGSKEIDSFIRSAHKQNAQIISDVVGFPQNSVWPHRIVTKKLPSGTFVTEIFDEKGFLKGKEIIKKNSKAVTWYGRDNDVAGYLITKGNKNIAKLDFDSDIVRWQPPYSITDGYKTRLDNVFENIRGVTEEVNKGNVFYDSQKAIWEAEQNMLKARRGY